jgi:hypothetical protein
MGWLRRTARALVVDPDRALLWVVIGMLAISAVLFVFILFVGVVILVHPGEVTP